uniref:Minor coat protein n=1 Tax=Lettuce chlorosis virus TaxID=642478 RepID=A0A6B9KZH1_9CLOS|nr:minor coat protein [Lettuce chlorosis virus]
MDREDFYEDVDGQIMIRADNNMWCQSHGMSILDIEDLTFNYLHSAEVNNSKFIFQIKITIPDGHLVYEFKFNDVKSHTFRQAGGKTWSNAYDVIGTPRALRVGVNQSINLKKERGDWILTVNGFRYIKIKGVYSPTDVALSLAYPIGDTTFDRKKLYITDFVRFKSVFQRISLNGNEFQPKSIRTYTLNLNTNDAMNMKIGRPLELVNIENISDFNIREEDTTPKPIPKPNDDLPPEVEKKPIPQPEPEKQKPDVPKPNDNSKPGGSVDPPNPIPPFPENKTPIKPSDVTDLSENVKSNIQAVERFKLYHTEIEDIFSKCVKHYVDKGFSAGQAELIIYQMGISFCTSKNSMGDLNSHLVWKRDDGKLIRLRKCDHVKLLNSLSRRTCNVERIVLRYYSDRILELLKKGALVPGFHHAKRRGVKQEYAYLVTDFFDYDKLRVSDQELQVMTSDLNYVLLKNKHKRSIVNVNQLY